MKERFINYFSKIADLSPQEIAAIVDTMSVKEFPKGSFLVREGQVKNDTFFVLKGCVRQFMLAEGNDITTNFYTEEQWIISLENFDEVPPSRFSLECLEDTAVVVGNEQGAQELFKRFPGFETISRKIMENVFLEQQNLMTSYLTDKPEQRYLKLLETRPELFQRVPQYHIATYIGVKPESLSRIRKKLQKKT